MMRTYVFLALLCIGACVINANPVPDSTPTATTPAAAAAATHGDDDVQIVNYSNDNVGANGYNFAYVHIHIYEFIKLYFNYLIFFYSLHCIRQSQLRDQ